MTSCAVVVRRKFEQAIARRISSTKHWHLVAAKRTVETVVGQEILSRTSIKRRVRREATTAWEGRLCRKQVLPTSVVESMHLNRQLLSLNSLPRSVGVLKLAANVAVSVAL